MGIKESINKFQEGGCPDERDESESLTFSKEEMVDFIKYYNIESYLFNTVRLRNKENSFLNAFDFFCIVIWKANRAKSKIAKKLLKISKCENLEGAVKKLTTGLSKELSPKAKLRYLIQDWQFLLPMASAILTVLYPDEFTIYDIRVCEVLKGFNNLTNLSNFEKLWEQYECFKRAVENSSAPASLALRDKDRYLWGESFYKQLNNDIKQKFNIKESVGK